MNEERRNPYATTEATLTTNDVALPQAISALDGVVEYGSFLRRLGALLLDFLILMIGTRNVSDEAYYSMNYFEKSLAIANAAPSYYPWIGRLVGVWMLAVAISILCTNRRRALHDFIAGTVVIRERQ